MFHPDPKSTLRSKRFFAGAAALAILATGLLGYNQMQTAGAAPATSGCRTTSTTLVADPNNPNQQWLERHCDVSRGIAIYTDNPNAATFPSPMAAIGYVKPGDNVFYCETQSSHVVEGNSWWGLTKADVIIDQASSDIVHGLGWLPAAAVSSVPKNQDAVIPGVPNCGKPYEFGAVDLWGGINETGQTTPVGTVAVPAVVPAVPAVVPAAPAVVVPSAPVINTPSSGDGGTPAKPYNKNAPMRNPSAPTTCPTTGATESREGTEFKVVSCTALAGAPVNSYVSSAGGAPLRTLTAGPQPLVCQQQGPANPTSKNRDGTVNHNNWWLLTAKSDGAQGWVPATWIAQGGENERVLPREWDCPSSQHPA